MPKSASSIMKQRIVLQKRVLTENTYGERNEQWQDVTPLHASVEPLVGREFFQGGLPQRLSEIDSRIRIRYRKGLNNTEYRITYENTVYTIVSVIQDRARGQTQLMVKATSIKQADGVTIND